MNEFEQRLSKLTPDKLAVLIRRLQARIQDLEHATLEPIAVVGMACRFPGAPTLEDFWSLLHQGRDAIQRVPEDRWDADALYDPDPDAPGKMTTRWGGFIEHADRFDADLFRVAPREAERMDPQQRLLLEVTWEALERAGIAPDGLLGSRTGVYVGICNNDYAYRGAVGDYARVDAYGATGNAHSVAAGRLSYFFGFEGPSLAIDTSCSSSLVAVHLAAQSLRAAECRMALAAGVNLMLSPELTIVFSKARMMSADGRCKTFDARADGYVRGEGCGVVVLKRLSDAQADGDRIMGLIRGSAVNQDGRSSSLTAPNDRAQAEVIREALAAASIDPAAIDYIEAHGTGTPLGDPIEIRALGQVLGRARPPSDPPFLVGSVKTNIGHTEAAAGVAGLIKTILAIEHQSIPPHLHFERPNPHLDLDEARAAVPRFPQPWRRGERIRRAGISSFGFSGTNCHLVVEEPPVAAVPPTEVPSIHLLTLSARSPAALEALRSSYVARLSQESIDLGALCSTANTGRARLSHRIAVTGADRASLRARLGEARLEAPVSSEAPTLAFLFTGQGAQHPGMGRRLYEVEPVFRRVVDRAAEILDPLLELPIRKVLFEDERAIHQTQYTQPALFVLEHALFELLGAYGIRPRYVLGHSIGEYAAAWAAGAIELEDALRLVALRGRLMGGLPAGGAMLAAFTDEAAAQRALQGLNDRATIAAINGPRSIVLSGEGGAIDTVSERLSAGGVTTQRLEVSHAFHSPLMDPILDRFQEEASKVAIEAPRLGLISNLTGRLVSKEELGRPGYWRDHLRNPVRFAAGIETLRAQGVEHFVELGPLPSLISMGRRCTPEGYGVWVPTLRKGREDDQQIIDAVAELYTRGVNVDGRGPDRERRRRVVDAPTYPFERKRYWIEEPPRVVAPEVWAPTVAAARARARDGVDDRTLASLPQEIEALEGWCAGLIAAAFGRLGVLVEGQGFTTRELQATVRPRYAQLVRRALDALARQGNVELDGAGGSCIVLPSGERLAQMEADARTRLAHSPALLALVERAGARYGEVLVGQEDPLGLLFPGGSFEIAEGLYSQGPSARYFNRILAHAVAAIAAAAPDRELRVLEVGGGTGGSTDWILPELPGDRSRYIFTDLSRLFLDRAKARFERYGFVEHQIFDLERPAAEQGLEAKRFDLVIASNVLHATRDLPDALDNLRSVMAPGGVLLIWEMTAPSIFFDLTFGLLLQELADDRADGTPFPAPEVWSQLLTHHGFDTASFFPEPGAREDLIGQHVILAKAASGAGARAFSLPAEKRLRVHPLLGVAVDGTRTAFRAELSTMERLFADHRVHGATVVPAAAFVEIARAVAAEQDLAGIAELSIIAPLLLHGGEDGVLETSFDRAASRVRIVRRRGDEVIVHAEATLERELPTPEQIDLSQLRHRIAEEIAPADYYRALAEVGLDYGPDYQRIKALWRAPGEALVELATVSEAGMHFAPQLLDAAFQAIGAAMPDGARDEALMPVIARRIAAFGAAPTGALFAQVVHLQNEAARVRIFDERGALALLVDRLELRRAPREALMRFADRPTEGWRHELSWKPHELASPRSIEGQRWLVLGSGVLAEAAQAELRSRGAEVAAASDHVDERLSERWDGVLHLLALDPHVGDDGSALVRSLEVSVRAVLSVVASGVRSRLCLVTSGAQSIFGRDLTEPRQAALWGLGRSLALEHPELSPRWIDLDPRSAPSAVALIDVIAAETSEDQIVMRGPVAFVPRMGAREGNDVRRLEADESSVALRIEEKGTLDGLALVPLTRRSPGPGEVEIEVRAAGLNFLDVMDALGALPFSREGLGNECAGVVTAVGEGVVGVRPGDSVVAIAAGCLARHVVTNAAVVVKKPVALSYDDAAAVPIAAVTVKLALASLKAGQRVLIHAGAGGVGLAAVAYALEVGAEIHATAGTPEKRSFLRAMGVHRVYSSRTLEFAAQVIEHTAGQGVDLVLNSLAGEYIAKGFEALREGGTFVEIGKVGIWTAERVAALGKGHDYQVVALEQLTVADPLRVCGLLAECLDAAAGGRWARPRVRSFPLEESVAAFRLMQQARHVGKIVIRPEGRLTFDPEGAYVIAGGLGGLGRLVARWLVDRGARRLVILARRAPIEALPELRALGAEVKTLSVDISDRSALDVALRQVRADVAPIRGVFQVAGRLADGVVAQQTWERFEEVLSTKVAGGWNLHQLTVDDPLHIFQLFSSVAALGSPGQSNHSAACAFEDALAHHRRAMGLPAQSINWGAWSRVGAAAERGVEARFRREGRGISTIDPSRGLRLLERILVGGRTQEAVLPIDWPVYVGAIPEGAEPPLFLDLIVAARAGSAGGRASMVATTDDADRERLIAHLMAVSDPRASLIEHVSGLVSKVLGRSDQPVHPRDRLMDLGLDSLMAIELRNALVRMLGRPLPSTLMFDHPTVEAIAEMLASELGAEVSAPPQPVVVRGPSDSAEPIAVVGIGCRFPGGASDPDRFWSLLEGGFDAIREVPLERWDLNAHYDADPNAPRKMYARHGAFLEHVDELDAGFFKIGTREAVAMDPQQRLLLEASWEALEHAGISPDSLYNSPTGVFVGVCGTDYARICQASDDPELVDGYLVTGNAHSVAAGRISYILGLQGPSVAIDTACSSSLVSTHLACQALRAGECETALAGGVNLILTPETSVIFCKARMLSVDGHCKTFDAAADGYVRGEGCGVVVLKRLSSALAAGDRVWAVIRGSAVNQDGPSTGLTAPNGPAQQEVIRRALAQGGVDPLHVGYVEAHGTGTPLGDPIELQALAAALTRGRKSEQPLVVGSIKTNVGHLEGAAGIAGLIKAILALHHRFIPPHLHFRALNPHVAMNGAAIEIATALRPFEAIDGQRIAGVSSFGIGGTNAHVVLAEAPAPPPKTRSSRWHVLPLSARSARALDHTADALRTFLTQHPRVDLADVAHTLQVGRAAFDRRRALVARDVAEAVWVLSGGAPDQTFDGLAAEVAGAMPEEPEDAGARAKVWARAWVTGVSLSAEALADGHRVSLPTYPFERQRYWPSTSRARSDVEKQAIEDWFYVPSWKQAAAAVSNLEAGVRCCIVSDGGPLARRAVQSLRARGVEVIVLEAGGAYAAIDEGLHRVDPTSSDDHVRALRASLGGRSAGRTYVLHFLGAGPAVPTDFDAAQRVGFYSLLALSRALDALSIDAEIVAVTRGVHDVTGAEVLVPERATVTGPLKVVPQEHPGLPCRHLDLEVSRSEDAELKLADRICDEVLNEGPREVAFRGDRRWIRVFEPWPIQKTAVRALPERITILITGGLGDVCLMLAEHLARTAKARLVLTTRSAFLPRSAWDGPTSDDVRVRIERIRAIEALGGEVMVVRADVSVEHEMRAAVLAAEERFGPIRGVIHGAGVTQMAAFQPARQLGEAECELHFVPKARGLYVLEQVLDVARLELAMVLSSVSSVLGGIGFTAYAAANAFADAFVQARRAKGGVPWISVDWSEWAPTSIDSKRHQSASLAAAAMSASEGAAAFDRALGAGQPRLVVSPVLLAPRIQTWVDGKTRAAERPAATTPVTTRPRPDLREVYVAPGNDLETLIAQEWRSFLGVEPIGIHDNFFELGGDSVVGIELVARLIKRLGVQLAVVDLFASPTVATLARMIREGDREGALALDRSEERGSKRRAAQTRRRRPGQGEES